MATTMKAISAAMKLIDVKKENLRKAFQEVESHSSSLASFTLTWSDIDSHFTSLQSSLQHKFKFLQTLEIESQSPSPSIAPPKTNLVVRAARPQLKSLCQNMDGLGLRKYVIDRPKDFPKERETIRLEVLDALASAPDPGALILDAMDGFSSTNDLDLRRACVMLLEELMELKTDIKGEAREKALILAIDCKAMLSSVTNINKNTFGLLGFLLLVAVYGLRHAFTIDDLIDYVVAVAKNKIAVQLCRLLNFGDQISGLIQKLISNGSQILAVKFIYEFEMTNKFPPVSLLKAYAKESKFFVQGIRKSGDPNGQAMKEATMKELDHLKSVVKCIEDYKLESEFPNLNVLLQRIQRLEREKLNKKRSGAAPAPVPEKQTKLQKNSIINHFKSPDPATVAARNTMPEKQSNPASVTRETANLTIPENVAASSANPSYQQPPSPMASLLPNPYAVASTGPYGMAGSNPDIASYTGSSSGMYEQSGAPMGFNGNIPATSSSLYPAGSQMPSGYYDGNTAHTNLSSGQYEQSGAHMGLNGNVPAPGSSLYPPGSQMPSGYYDANTAHTGLSSGQYEQSGAPMGFNGNIPATGSSLYPPGSQMPSGYYDGNTAHAGLSSGVYEQSGPHMASNGNIPTTSSSVHPPGSHMPSGYYDGNSAYGGYGWPPEGHPSYYPQ